MPPRALDTGRLREEIAPLTRPQAVPAPAPVSARSTGDAAIAILKAAVAEERSRTTALRAELDRVRVILAEAEGRLDQMREQRDLWRHRTRVPATALCEGADEATPAQVDARSMPARAVA